MSRRACTSNLIVSSLVFQIIPNTFIGALFASLASFIPVSRHKVLNTFKFILKFHKFMLAFLRIYTELRENSKKKILRYLHSKIDHIHENTC